MRQSLIWPTWLLAFCLWGGSIAGGSVWLLRYSFAAGKSSAAPRALPSFLKAAPSSIRAQLVLALHPRCPCSMATVRELAKILTQAPETCDVTVLMYQPASEPDRWMEGALLNECRRLKCQIRPDPDGLLASSLGSLTSGEVQLYAADGTLRYQGGITAARGHEGDNVGETAVIENLHGNPSSLQSTKVFGCPIQSNPSQ